MHFNTRYQNRYNPREWYQKQFEPFYRSNLFDKPYLAAYDSPLQLTTGDLTKPIFAPLDKQDPLYAFFANKQRMLGNSVADVVGLIRERQEIKYSNLYKIEYDICKVMTRLHELDHWPAETNFSVERKRGQFESELLNFEREKRMEEVSCWRDVTRLRSELRELMTDVYGEQRRQQLIQGD